ncbi:MAG: enoyl-CoA hydratase/isomerase family protein [Dehalococcoidia bacterium]
MAECAGEPCGSSAGWRRLLRHVQPARTPEPLNIGVLKELQAACDSLGRDLETRVVVLQGLGRAFSAGADLKPEPAPAGAPRAAAGWVQRRRGAGAWQRFLDSWEALPQVTVARVQGWCIGGAMLLAIACDIRVGARDAKFSIPEVALGIPLTWGGLPRLAREIGLPRTRDLVMTRRVVAAEEALAWGIVTRLEGEDGLDAALEVCLAELLAMPAGPLELTKASLAAIGKPILAMGWADADLLQWSEREEDRAAAMEAYVRANVGKRPRPE